MLSRLRTQSRPPFARAIYSHAARRLSSSTSDPPAGSRAFLPSELPAVVDLFSDFADANGTLSPERLAKLLAAVGEPPDEALLSQLFTMADTDRSGCVDLGEFLAAADTILASNPQVLARCTLVVGGPGSGKGVLCARLVAECGMGHMSSGDMLREEVAADTPIGKEASEIMAKGDLVPSAMITAMLRRRLRGSGGRRLLLDGFPRSRQNAIDFAAQCGRPELALHLVCDEEVMIERILKRAEVEGRADDNIETARQRIKVFNESGAPTMKWLREVSEQLAHRSLSRLHVLAVAGAGNLAVWLAFPQLLLSRHAPISPHQSHPNNPAPPIPLHQS